MHSLPIAITLLSFRILIIGIICLSFTAIYHKAIEIPCDGKIQLTCGEGGCESLCFPLPLKDTNGQDIAKEIPPQSEAYSCQETDEAAIQAKIEAIKNPSLGK